MLRTTRWMGVELWPLAPEEVEHETPVCRENVRAGSMSPLDDGLSFSTAKRAFALMHRPVGAAHKIGVARERVLSRAVWSR